MIFFVSMAQRSGVCNLPLHTGKCPKWLFPRMKKLGGAISEIIINEFGVNDFLERLADPYFFQALGCTIGFDWHSSGLTVTTTAALKEALNEKNLGFRVAGGKGKTSRKAPQEIKQFSDEFNLSSKKRDKLVYSSRMSAKVDSNLIQDNYGLYHHAFFVTEKGKWCVIQQGMNNSYARRYHWLNESNFIDEPEEDVCCDRKEKEVLNLTDKKSKEVKKTSLDLVKDKNTLSWFRGQRTLDEFNKGFKRLDMKAGHLIPEMKTVNIKTLKKAYEIQPDNYEELVSLRGVGAKTLRSLALISELIYGEKASWKDPVKYSFAHGGKDNIPYPVDRKLMDKNTTLLKNALQEAKVGRKDKLHAVKRLKDYYGN